MDLGVTLAIIGIIVGVISLYYAREQTLVTVNQASATEKSVSIAQEGQITESFNRAIDQLGSEKMETRLGAISALEIIANKSDEYYWPIMEILTAYIRKNSPIEYGKKTYHFEYSYTQNRNIEVEDIKMQNKASLDISAIVTVIKRRRYFFNSGESNYLDLQGANLREANFQGANLQGANLKWTYLGGANFREANLQNADLGDANLQEAIFVDANLQEAFLERTYLRGAYLVDANLEGANIAGADFRKAFLYRTNLQGAYLGVTDFERAQFEGANLEGADFTGSNLIRAIGLTIDQLSKAKTLCSAEIDEDLLIQLKEKHPDIFKTSNPNIKDQE